MISIEEFKQWINRMEHYGNISEATAEKIVEFVEEQQKEIEHLSEGISL